MDWQTNIYVERKRRQSQFQMMTDHAHPHFELFYLVSGKCRVFLNHTLHHLEAGDVLFIPPQGIHHTIYGMAQESERIVLNFSVDCLKNLEDGGDCFHILFAAEEKQSVEVGRRGYVEHLMQKIMVEQDSQDEYSGLLKRNYMQELLVFLSRQEKCGVQVVPTNVQEIPIQEAAKYIYHHFAEPLTLSEIAYRVHMTPTYFSRKFKMVTGFGYKEYLNYVRLKEASRMLLETDVSITEIGVTCGFSDGNYFGDLFKKEKGISPRTYRKNPQRL